LFYSRERGIVTRNEWRTSGRKFIIYASELTFIAMMSVAFLGASGHAAGAASEYGPVPPPVGTAVPGFYTDVVTSQTITPAGGTIGPVTVDGATVTLVIPPGAFPFSIQITITQPYLFGVGNAGMAGYKTVAGVGILVQENGLPYPGTFLKPLTATIRTPLITSSSVMVVWDGAAFVPVSDSTVTSGAAVVSFDSDPDYAILAPLATTATTIPGATKAVTGKPFLGEGILACALVVLGVSGLAVGSRRWMRG
jgi:hypothetical protein